MRTVWAVVVLVSIIKTYLYIQRKLLSEVSVPPVEVLPGLGLVKNPDNTYNILNKRNVSFLLSPAPCAPHHWLLTMVSSGPANTQLRHQWRRRVAGRPGLKVVFLVANTTSAAAQAELEAEHEAEGDIVQCGVEDGHRLLGYKILCGHVWAHEHCGHVAHVAKSDDNVEVDLDTLTSALQSPGRGAGHWAGLVTCPTLCYGMRVIRETRAGMTGNWSHSAAEWDRDWMPAFCVGFLSITQPELGAQLAQVGLALYGDAAEDITQIEDSLITGVLRERLPHVRLEPLEVRGPVWRVFSWCSWLHMFKQTFFNDLIVSKRSSRSGVEYVGPVTSPRVWRFFLCVMVEGGLEMLEAAVPGLLPSFLWSVCAR